MRRRYWPGLGRLLRALVRRAPRPSPPAGRAREYRLPAAGLPPLVYDPRPDGFPDPGEVVWAWVPYEEDPRRGKDRPVLLLTGVPGGYLGVQLTSADRASGGVSTDRFGRRWLDVGRGDWDVRGRPSEVRLDRLLFLPPSGIRREGAALPEDRYRKVAAALRSLHG